MQRNNHRKFYAFFSNNYHKITNKSISVEWCARMPVACFYHCSGKENASLKNGKHTHNFNVYLYRILVFKQTNVPICDTSMCAWNHQPNWEKEISNNRNHMWLLENCKKRWAQHIFSLNYNISKDVWNEMRSFQGTTPKAYAETENQMDSCLFSYWFQEKWWPYSESRQSAWIANYLQ